MVAIAAGGAHALAVKVDGSVTNWGINIGTTPSGLTNVMAVAAGYLHSMVLKNDGTVIAWGTNTSGQTNVVSGLANVKAIAAGAYHSLAARFSTLIQYPIDVSKDMLLIYNSASSNSVWVKDYYLAHRPKVGSANVLGISYSKSNAPTYYETIMPSDLTNNIFVPVQSWLTANPTKRPQYVILFLDVPSRCNDTNFPVHTVSGEHPSVSFQFQSIATGWQPFVTHINMEGMNDCKAYIEKLASFGTNLVISASATNYGNTNYIVDSVRSGTCCIGGDYTGSGATVSDATNGLYLAGVAASAIIYTNGLEACSNCGPNILPHITSAVNVAGYISWGAHSSLGSHYATNGTPQWSGNSGWWIIQTIESYNGTTFVTDQGNFLQWFSTSAFGGTNYSNTPVGAVSHVDEPGVGSVNNSATYFGLWARKKNFAICAWNSRATAYFQAVGDPLVIK